MKKLVSLSVLAAFLAIGTVGCTSEPPKKAEGGSAPTRTPPTEPGKKS